MAHRYNPGLAQKVFLKIFTIDGANSALNLY